MPPLIPAASSSVRSPASADRACQASSSHDGTSLAPRRRRRPHAVDLLGLALLGLLPVSAGWAQETIGGGTIDDPATGPAPSYGIGGPGFVLVKNWDFGADGTIKNYSDLSAHFYYHNHNQVTGPQIGYGAYVVAPDNATKIGNQPVEGVNTTGPVREFTSDSLKTYIVPLNGATLIKPSRHDAGSGSFYAKWKLDCGGSVLNQDILWETRVRYVPPKQFWFSPWVAGTQWTAGAGPEVDLIESYGYLSGGVWQNVNGQYWHSAVSRNKEVDYSSWPNGMSSVGITGYDASQYHTITWLFRRDNTCRVFVDNVEVQRSTGLPWRMAALASGIPVDLHFLFDATWGYTGTDNTNNEMAASELAGKYFEWDYSRVYLRGTANLPPIDNVSAVQNPAGSWSSSTVAGEGRYYGVDYLHDGNTGKGTKTITYTPDIPETGQYEVYAFWPGTPAGQRATNTPFTIVHADGTTTVTRDQNYPVVTGGGTSVAARWNSLGIYTFNAGTSGSVTIGTTGTTHTVIADAIYFVPVERESIVVDNSDSGFSKTGAWTSRNAAASQTEGTVGQYSKTGYYDDGNAGKGSKTATFTPNIPATGTYKVYGMWNSPGTGRATNVPYSIYHADGTASLTVNQNTGGGQWNLLGTYTFNAGTAGKVVLSNTGTDGTVVADAVRFVWVAATEEFTLDNDHLSANASSDSQVIFTGDWASSKATAGYYGNDYIHDGNTGKGAKSVEFAPDLPSTGNYEVFARWTADTNRAAHVPVDIVSAAGTDSLELDQTQNGGRWVSLGTYGFDAGPDGASVLIGTGGTSGYVVADAVKFARVPDPSALVVNPGFEADGPGAQTITGWSESGGNPGASYIASTVAAHGGSYYLGHYATTAYDVFTYQTRTGLPNGSYTLKAWVQRTGYQTTARMEASGFGGSTLTAGIPTATTWTQIVISGINVTNGTCTFGFRSVSPAGSSLKVDDVEFYKP